MEDELERLRAENAKLKEEKEHLKNILFSFTFNIKNTIFMISAGAEIIRTQSNELSDNELDNVHEIIFNAAEKQNEYFMLFDNATKYLRPDFDSSD